MFTRPEDLDDHTLRSTLSSAWGFDAVTLSYTPVGFGSHHWIARDSRDDGRFVTVDEVPTADDRHRLACALVTASVLQHQAGLDFVVAPFAARDVSVLQQLNDRYAVAVYPLLHGEPVGVYGEYRRSADRDAVLDLIIELHAATAAVVGHARRDNGELRERGHILAALDALDGPWDRGPYGEPCRRLLAEHAVGVERLMVTYDALAAHVLANPQRTVITHGEPHAGNVMIIDGRHLLVDWDTALLAAPERDLWDLDPGDGSVLAAYAAKTGTTIDSDALTFYKLWYDLDEIGGYVSLFREEHDETEDICESWRNLVHFLRPAERWPELMT